MMDDRPMRNLFLSEYQHRSWHAYLGRLLPLLLLTAQPSLAQSPEALDSFDVSSSLQSLLQTEVNTVSKTRQSVADSAAAIYVLPGKDIMAFGCRSIPEALRMVPGMHVAQIGGRAWAVAIRGLNGELNRNLLVAVDGRIVYNPALGSTDWDLIDVFMEDIDRIEVVRGSGGAIWGSNAVNGVINVITKSATKTIGGMVAAGGGIEEKRYGSFRYGWKDGNSAFRTYIKNRSVDGQKGATGNDIPGDGHNTLAGFRFDHTTRDNTKFTLQGEANQGTLDGELTYPAYPKLGYVVDADAFKRNFYFLRSEVNHSYDNGDETNVKSYVSYSRREFGIGDEHIGLGAIDAQHRTNLSSSNTLITGFGYRATRDDYKHLAPVFEGYPRARTYSIVSGFAQDEQTFFDSKLRITAGIKVEHNQFTGVEWQPSLRFVGTPAEDHRIWAAFGRTVRIPTRLESNYGIHLPNPIVSFIETVYTPPGSDLHAEQVISSELGYRFQPSVRFYVDFATFYNRYSETSSYASPTFTSQGIVLPRINAGGYNIYGGEMLLDYQISRRVKYQGWYALLVTKQYNDGSTGDAILDDPERSNPKNQVGARLQLALSPTVKLALGGRYIDSMSAFPIRARTDLDSQITWSALPSLDLSLVGRNLCHSARAEYGSSLFRRERVELIQRRVYAQALWRF
jgi:iron complex outermembrane receptor protein